MVKRIGSKQSTSTSPSEVHFHWPKAPPDRAQESAKARSVARYDPGPCSKEQKSNNSRINQEQVAQGAGRCAVRSALRKGEGKSHVDDTHKGASSAEVYSRGGYPSNRFVQEDSLFKGSKRDLGRWGPDGSAGISANTLKIFLGIILFLREVTQ
ncbi:hypothetical protein B0H19DRAFT_1077249 [Mycena capillaripes]|nr:hypothetical protein B0H19DRAFT_1077249 [Mycena capillaripes]